MESINLSEIKTGDTLQYFDAQFGEWELAEVALAGMNFLYIQGLTGSLSGVQWTEDYSRLVDPEHYQKHIVRPDPPQKPKKRMFINFSTIGIIVCVILLAVNIIITIFLR